MEKNGELREGNTPNLPKDCKTLEHIPEDIQKDASDKAKESLSRNK